MDTIQFGTMRAEITFDNIAQFYRLTDSKHSGIPFACVSLALHVALDDIFGVYDGIMDTHVFMYTEK